MREVKLGADAKTNCRSWQKGVSRWSAHGKNQRYLHISLKRKSKKKRASPVGLIRAPGGTLKTPPPTLPPRKALCLRPLSLRKEGCGGANVTHLPRCFCCIVFLKAGEVSAKFHKTGTGIRLDCKSCAKCLGGGGQFPQVRKKKDSSGICNNKHIEVTCNRTPWTHGGGEFKRGLNFGDKRHSTKTTKKLFR